MSTCCSAGHSGCYVIWFNLDGACGCGGSVPTLQVMREHMSNLRADTAASKEQSMAGSQGIRLQPVPQTALPAGSHAPHCSTL